MCSTFLWKGDVESHNSARVAWSTAVLSKEQGGLGIKDLQTWNLACCLRLIWLLFFRPDSVWVSWFKEVVLQGSIHNYWTTNPKTSFSWLSNKLLKLKSVVFPLIRLQIQNGRSGRFWFDNWTPFGSLDTYLGASASRLGISRNATVASLNRNGSLLLPNARTEEQLNLLAFITTVQLNSQPDYYEWVIEGKVSEIFKTG